MTENQRQPAPAATTTAIATSPPGQTGAMIAYDRIADPMSFVAKFGDAMYASKMFGCNNAEQGRVLAMVCLCERKTPTEIIRTYHLMGGKLQMKADAMLAEFRKLGGKHTILQRDADVASVRLELNGDAHAFTFTFQDAAKEPFVRSKDGKSLKDNWATPRARMQMLWARVVSDGVRAMAPEVNAGYYTPEEVADFSPTSQPPLSAEAEQRRDELLQKAESEIVDAQFEPAARPQPEPMAQEQQPAATQPQQSAQQEQPQQQSQPAVQAAPEASTQAVHSEGKTTPEQIEQLKGLLQALQMPPEKWKQALEKRGVTTVKDLEESEAEALIGKLTELKNQKQANDELSQWAGQAAGGAPGN